MTDDGLQTEYLDLIRRFSKANNDWGRRGVDALAKTLLRSPRRDVVQVVYPAVNRRLDEGSRASSRRVWGGFSDRDVEEILTYCLKNSCFEVIPSTSRRE